MSAWVASRTPGAPSSVGALSSFLALTAIRSSCSLMRAATPHGTPYLSAVMNSDVYPRERPLAAPPFAGLLGGGGSGVKKAVDALGNDGC